jgi:membrane-associated phospholipid phosphatase
MRVIQSSLGILVLLIFVALNFVDEPVARFFYALPWSRDLRVSALDFPILVALSGAIIIVGAVQIALSSSLRRHMTILIIAAFSLTSSVCIDELILKPIFGRNGPINFLQSGIDKFHWFEGTTISSFPSGHAVQVVSVGTAFWIAYPRQRFAWLALMILILVMLVAGNWHFVSDVIAGAGVGAIGAVATTLLWRLKSDGEASRCGNKTGLADF